MMILRHAQDERVGAVVLSAHGELVEPRMKSLEQVLQYTRKM